MRNLLTANIKRLKMNRSFWITVIIMIGIELMFGVMLMNQHMPMDNILFLSILWIGILLSIFLSSFTGTEYHDGTIRNKIIVGHKRNHIYLASLLTGIAAATIIYLAALFTGGIIGILFYEEPLHQIHEILTAIVLGWLASVSYVSIFNLIGMISISKAKTSVISILIAFSLIFVGALCFSLLSGGENLVIQFLYEFNPFGQTIQAMGFSLESVLKLIVYALSLSGICNGIGLYVFSSKALK